MTALRRFLNPGSVAVIGASPDASKIRGRLIKVLRQNGYGGEVYPVNPSYAELDGRRCFPDPAAVGAPIDLALVAVPAAAVLPALEGCAAAGVGHAVVISSGFAEDSGAPPELQDDIAALARRSGMRVCGPNSEGFHNEVDRVTVTFSPAVESELEPFPALPGPRVGVVGQSGGMGFALFNRGRALGLPFSHVITTGNEADLTLADFFAHLAEDEATGGILLFLEAVRDPAGFRRAADAAAAAGKPVVAIKVGSSGAGRAAAASHTASLTGWDEAYRALFRRTGIVPATDLDEALAAMAGLLTNRRARGGRVGVITVSGGAGALAADTLSAAGLELPELTAASQEAIRSFIPSYGATRNPVDITAQGAGGGGTLRAAELLLEDDAIDQIAVVISLANTTKVPIEGEVLAGLLARRGKPILLASYTLPSPLAHRVLAEAGAVVFRSLTHLATAAAALATPPGAQLPPPRPLALEGEGLQTEHRTKVALAALGVAIAPSVLVRAEGELAAAAELLDFPLALKIQSPDIPHKTEAGGVRLGVADVAALRVAWAEMLATVRRPPPRCADRWRAAGAHGAAGDRDGGRRGARPGSRAGADRRLRRHRGGGDPRHRPPPGAG